MKLSQLIFNLSLTLIILSYAVYPACYYNHYTGPDPDHCARNAWEGEDRGKCPKEGTTCEIVCDDEPILAGDLVTAPGGFILSGILPDNSVTFIVHTPTLDTTIVKSHSLYIFAFNERLRIYSCDEYPELEGVDVSLDGLYTDENGYFEVFIPIEL